MENNYELKINNKEVFEFYNKHNLDFENINLIFFNILQKLITDVDSSFDENVSHKLLNKFNSLDSKIENINNSIIKYQNDVSTIFAYKFNECTKEYIGNLKLVLSSNNSENITPLIRDYNDKLFEKISNLLPKNQEVLSKDIETHFKLFNSSLVNETNKLLTSSFDKTNIDNFLSNINQSFNQSHTTLTTLISSSENKIENRINETERKMNELKELTSSNNSSQIILQNNINELLKKFENGSSKGNISEHLTYNILLTLYPCAHIEHVGNEQKETGDIILIRNNKPKILIENKDHDSKNVPKHEVDKFIRDCEIQNCSGIMFAQHRGITNKENFEIQIHNKNVLLYVHEVNFDNNIIKTSIEIVENFKIKLDEISYNTTDFTIETETLEEINKDFSEYINQKNNMIKLLKDFDEKMAHSINELKMPTLEKYLGSKFAYSFNQNDNICKFCEKFIPKSLAQHLRYCTAKKDFEHKNNTHSNIQESIINLEINNNIKKSVKPKK